ncbi:bacterioferritin [Candidatus Endolissoclinum faulkneri L5]|uniref:Bacterioferritin n=1 Tax=Candidatus Endolissoclinum faulkneri L5 TaxID=1401328 RepID=V9TTF4_9PROT|nr:bacterioferritin [Candidatus Endolissoclinum faulkneri L5]
MQSAKTIIEQLNGILKNELTAISQFFLHSRILGEWGVNDLSKKAYLEAMEEMEHADKLIKRILFLEGLPDLQTLKTLRIGKNVKEIIECDLAVELDALPFLRDAIADAQLISDYVSSKLLVEILEDEEEHMNYLKTQLDLLSRIGSEHYTHLKSVVK